MIVCCGLCLGSPASVAGNSRLKDSPARNPRRVDRRIESVHDDSSGGNNQPSITIRSIPTPTATPGIATKRHLQPYEDLSCDVFQDDCLWSGDGVCDRTDGFCTLDCQDCDECLQFNANCEQCSNHNCYWCPGDATCRNSDQYSFIGKASSCTATTNYLQGLDNTCLVEQQLFNDPLYEAQSWVYRSINVEDVWRMGYTGQGVRVRIHDTVVDAAHTEFSGRFDVSTSCQDYMWSSSSLPPLTGGSTDHGTVVAAIVGAAANNGLCSAGIAPGVTLSACNVFSLTDPNEYIESLEYDVANQSFGVIPCRRNLRQRQQQEVTSCPFTARSSQLSHPCDLCETFSSPSAVCQSAIIQHCMVFWKDDQIPCLDYLHLLLADGRCYYTALLPVIEAGLQRAIQEGRDGKGIIFVTAVGNSYDSGGYATTIGFAQSRFTILVGSVDKLNGGHASYSLPGPALFVTAPGGDGGTTVANHVTASPNNQCADAGAGTSFACPVVTGVVALMLEARPALTWRDVQGIFAMSSQIVIDDSDLTAVTNSAGYWHSDYYGFGIVDALAAVQAALTWTLLPEETILGVESGFIGAALVDDASVTTTSTLTLASSAPAENAIFFTESVQVYMLLDYVARGHLEIILWSPSGTRAVLHPGRRPEYTQSDYDEAWTLLSVKTWGEDPMGDWTLQVTDVTPGDTPTEDTCIDANWSVLLFDSSELTCMVLTKSGACQDGVLNPLGIVSEQDMAFLMNQADENGVLPTQACCSCGAAGIDPTNVPSQLRQWMLIAYGHWQSTPTPVPTVQPIEAPTNSPTTPLIPPTVAQDTSDQSSGPPMTPPSNIVVPSSQTPVASGVSSWRPSNILVGVLSLLASIVFV